MIRILLLLLLPCLALAGAPVDDAFDEIGARVGVADARVRLLTDNQESWYARWYLIENARTSIDCTYFMIYDELWSKAFLGLLLKKAKEGVRIRICFDSKGATGLTRSFFGKDFLQELAELPNVEIRVFNPIRKGLLKLFTDVRAALASSHDKILIADGEWVITGGRNIGQVYCADPRDNPQAFRDTDILIHGGAVPAQAKRAFDEEFHRQQTVRIGKDLFGNWDRKTRELEMARRILKAHMIGMKIQEGADAGLMAEMERYPHLSGYAGWQPFRGERERPTLLLDHHAAGEGHSRDDIFPNLEKLIDAAEDEIVIQNPYVILTDRARAAFKRAADRGVKLVLVTNSPVSSDSMPTQVFFVKEWKHLMADLPTLRILACKEHRLQHSKVFVFDRRVTVIGSYNLDPLSDQVNSEEVAVVKSPEFAAQNRRRIVEDDVANCLEYKIRRVNDSVEQVFGPSDHVPADSLKWLEKLGTLEFLRPVI